MINSNRSMRMKFRVTPQPSASLITFPRVSVVMWFNQFKLDDIFIYFIIYEKKFNPLISFVTAPKMILIETRNLRYPILEQQISTNILSWWFNLLQRSVLKVISSKASGRYKILIRRMEVAKGVIGELFSKNWVPMSILEI